MPKRHVALPPANSCDRITQLLQRHLPDIFVSGEKQILQELVNIENGHFHRRVEDLRAAGRRLAERELMERRLLEHDIDLKQIQDALGVNRTTISRFFKGDSATGLRERILNFFSDEFIDFPDSPDRDPFFAGYHHAVLSIRKQVLLALESSYPAKPALTFESFCFLWHTLRSEAWRLAMHSMDEGSLETAAARVAQQVQKEPPIYQTRSFKAVKDLIKLQKEWGLWFRLVVFCSNERDQFPPHDEHPGEQL